jgi:hypothetical protein
MSEYRKSRRFRLRVFKSHDGFIIRLGRLQCRYSWSRAGMFGNGSRWSSGWHDWTREDDI